MKQTVTLLERIGGQRVVDEVCDALHARIMLDERLAHFFDGLEIADIQAQQQKFMACLLDDVKLNDLGRLQRIHEPLVAKRGLSHSHFDAMKHLLDDAMREVGIDAYLRRLVVNRMETTREAIFINEIRYKGNNNMKRIMTLMYGIGSYAVGMGSLVYISAWLLGIGVATPLDAPATFTWGALAFNIALVAAFALQHSGMARPAFKRFVSNVITPPIERSTYVLFSGLATVALCYFWQPLGIEIWAPQTPAVQYMIYAAFAAGHALLVMSTFWINHFDLFGLRQVWLYFRGEAYTHVPFKTPGMYAVVRHPLYIGWMVVIWAAPVMTVSHLVFALATTIYIFRAIRWEERDLCAALPEYRRYRAETPMLVPRLNTRPTTTMVSSESS